MPFFDYGRNVSLNSYLNNTAVSLINTYQIALLVNQADAGDSASSLIAKEPSGYNYARITTSGGMWTVPVSGHTNAQLAGHGVVENKATLTFNTASGPWGTIIQTAVLIGQSGGSFYPLFYGPVRAEVNPTANMSPLAFLPGQYHIEIRGNNFADSTRDQIMLGYFGTGNTSYWPTTYYLALLTVLPEPDSTGFNEIQTPGTNGYARVACANSNTVFTTANTGITYNTIQLNFPQPTGAWGSSPVTAWALMDASSSGVMWFYGPLYPAIPSIGAASPAPSVNAGQLSVSLDAINSNIG